MAKIGLRRGTDQTTAVRACLAAAFCVCLLTTGCRSARGLLSSRPRPVQTARVVRPEFPEQAASSASGMQNRDESVVAPLPPDTDNSDRAANRSAANGSLPVLPPESDPLPPASDSALPLIADVPPPETPEQVIQRIGELGGNVARDYEGAVTRVDLSFQRVSDSAAPMLQLLPGIRELDLTGTDIGDEGMIAIATVSSLQSLRLRGTKVTDGGLAELPRLSSLRLLDLGHTAITDDALIFVGRLPDLSYLLLHETQVTDDGLEFLADCGQLRGLNLIGTRVTNEGIDRLRARLPECVIISQDDLDVSGIRLPAELRLAEQLQSASDPLPRDPRFRRLLGLAQEQPDLAVHLSRVYSEREEWTQAAAILRIAAETWPDDESVQFRLAEALVHSGETDEGTERFRTLLGESAARYHVGLIVYIDALKRSEVHLAAAMQADPANRQVRARLDDLRAKLRAVEQGLSPVGDVAHATTPMIVPGSHDEAPAAADRMNRSDLRSRNVMNAVSMPGSIFE